MALEKQGQYEQAVAEFDQALLLDPAYRRTYPTFAMLLATCPDEQYRDGKLALELATKAVKMDAEKTPEPLSALAAANAEKEHFEEAVKWQTKAIELMKDEKTKKEARQRLELYQAGKPYRAPRPGPASTSS